MGIQVDGAIGIDTSPGYGNPPDGNRGMVKVQPTRGDRISSNPPDGNRGMVKVQPTRGDRISSNPPDGNRGMVKIQPSRLQERSPLDARKVGL